MNAIITGATKGMGRAIALKLASLGYNLAICSRNDKDLIDLEIQLKEFNVNIHKMVADMSKKEEVYAFCSHVDKVFTRVDVLVNNVGIFIPGAFLDESDSDFEYQEKLNLNAVYYLSKHVGKVMRSQQSGHIFNICSIASTQVVDNAGSYSVTKTAMLSLNHVLRKELSKYNVKVTAILPGSTLTASWEGTEINPEKFVQPEDIANSLATILTLSSGVNVDELILTPLNF